MAFTPYGRQPLTQPGPYDAAPRPAGGGYGGPSAEFGINNLGRNGIVQALMAQAQPPPGLVPNNTSLDMPGLGQPQLGQPAGVGQQPGLGGAGAMAPAAPMTQPGLGLPGTMQPGQLPMGMAPQAVTGAPPLPMPPRYGA
jgi:hypothetical protein